MTNAKDIPLNLNSGTVPDMSGALLQWLQPMVFGLITKTVNGFQVSETVVELTFKGVWQPFADRQLMMKPEGQRAWSWYWLHSDPSLTLKVDDVVEYNGKQYRVMSKKNYELYKYVEYHLVTDWTGSGPTVEGS